jgi:hypothetical protein
VDTCPACLKPLVDSPYLSAVTWTTPATTKEFERRCPWCAGAAEPCNARMTYGYRCACGAFALGAPAWDFDEVIDDAMHKLGLSRGVLANRAEEPRWWLELAGVDYKEGGKLGDSFYYWFKRVR